MDNLNWIREPRHTRTPEQKIMREEMMNEWLANNSNYRYDILGDVIEVTAQPTPIDKHNFTPSERITLDYDGRF